VKSREDLSFEYTPDQWERLSRLLEKQYAAYQWTTNDILNGLLLGNSTLGYPTKLNRLIEEKRVSKEPPAYTMYSPTMGDDFYLTYLLVCPPIDIIRCVLECGASYFYFERYDTPRQKADRKTNQAEAKKVIQCCDFIMSALSNDRGYGSLGRSCRSLNIDDGIQKLRKEAERTLRVNSYDAPTKKHTRHDSARTEYLNRLCRFWVALGGLPTTSFDGLKGRAVGDFVDFIRLAAGPILPGKITENGARRAIENWRRSYRGEPGILTTQGGYHVLYAPSGEEVRLQGEVEFPPPLPGYARLKKSGRRKRS
jgi:hypothetical protein